MPPFSTPRIPKSRWEALQKDKNFFAEYDYSDKFWYVMGVETDYDYACFESKEEAQSYAFKLKHSQDKLRRRKRGFYR